MTMTRDAESTDLNAQLADQRQRLAASNQQHLLDHFDKLTSAERGALLAQIAEVDLALMDRLFGHAQSDDQCDWAALARRAQPPQTVVRGPDAADGPAALARGSAALSDGKVAVLLVAGGQGTRLGFDHPKGLYPIGPVSGNSLFQILLEKVLAASRQCGAAIPVYLMTSHATHEETVAFLAANDNFGLASADVHVFQQGAMPAVDAESGRLLLEEPGRLFLSPDGHGGTLAALAANGILDDFAQRGMEHLFYAQVDNPLAPICDPCLIGHHLLGESELTSLAVPKVSPEDKLGNFVSVDGDAVRIIEYSDFPADVAAQREPDGSLKFWAGSVAVHVFDVAFLRRMVGREDALPFHIAHKKVPTIDAEGRPIKPDTPNALKFERFIFDLLPHAERALVVERAREEVFAPLKNADGAATDTATHVRAQMMALHRHWLEQAGADVTDAVDVEISPLWTDLPQVRGASFAEPTYLR